MASVSLAANPAVSANTGADGSFLLLADQPWGKVQPPLFPATRPVEHTIVVEKSGYLRTYRGIPGAQASGLTLMLASTIPNKTDGQGSALAPHVAQYHGERRAAVTMTFDDTHLSQIAVAKPLFDQYGYKATFFVNSLMIGTDPGQDTTWPMWQAVAADGYEIGNHTNNHWLKPECTADNAIWNHDSIFGGYDDIKAGIGKPPLTFAFPGGGESACTEPLVAASGHIDWRRDNHSHGDESDRVYPEGDALTDVTAIVDIDTVIENKVNWNGAALSWFLFYMHDVTPDRVEVLKTMLEYISVKDDQVWCAGYGEVTLYEREREQSKLDVLQQGKRTVTFRLSNALDPATFAEPLTVIVQLTPGTRELNANAFRDPAAGPVEVRVRSDRLLVDVIPGSQPVHVTW